MSSRAVPTTYDHRPLQLHPGALQAARPLQMAPLAQGGLPNASSVQHPSSARLSDLLEFVKAEFEQVSGESGLLRAQREEYEAMINHHANELNAMRQISYDLERKHNDLKNAYEDEITRLRRQIDSLSVDSNQRTTLPPVTTSLNASGSGLAHLPSSSNNPRPNLPPLASAAASVRPASPPRISSATSAPTVGHGPSNLFGGGMIMPGANSERSEHGAYSSAGEHPSKRMRSDEEDRFSKSKGSAAPPPFNSKQQSTHPHSLPPTLSRPPSTTPGGPSALHHPSSLPPPPGNGNHSHSHSASASASSSTLPPRGDAPTGNDSGTGSTTPNPPPKQGSKELDKPMEFDPETVTKDLKKEGSDWMTMFNPNVKRVLDVGLVHTLVHDSVVCCVKFSPDGKILATGCNRNTTLYDTRTGAKMAVFIDDASGSKTDNYIRSASFSPDGTLLATGSEDRIIRIWNVKQKRIEKIFHGHKSEIYSLAFSPDGLYLASGSGDKTARKWEMESGRCLFTLSIDEVTMGDNGPVDAGVTSVVLSPDGKFLAAGSLDTIVRIWDASTGKLLDKLKGHHDSVYSVAFSPDGKFLVSGSLDKTLKLWNMDSLRSAISGSAKAEEVGEGGKTLCMSTLQGHKDYVLSVDISPDGAWIVSGSKDRGVQFWDPKSGKAQFMLQGHKNSVISVAVAPTGGLLASASGDWSARIWSFQKID